MGRSAASPKILVAPLDWGLGHATRCVPIIRELLRQNAEVLLAAEGKTEALLRSEFPQLRMLHLPGYRIEYAASGWELALKIVAQIPKLLSAIKEEQAWLQKVVKEEKIDAVISDNRYGLYHPDIASIFVTHQLLIKAPVALAEDFLQELNYRYINKFNECWVPDSAIGGGLAGVLSHPAEQPAIPLRYVGPLSRFSKPLSSASGNYLLVLLSGPEPQRTLLEKILLEETKDYTSPLVLVRGLPDETETLSVAENMVVFNHLPAAELEEKVAGATLVIARCGYSTVMDLAALKKRSILIPTPGQTEQEYLAAYLMQKNFALCVEQKKIRLKHVLSLAENFTYRFPENESALQPAVGSLLETIRRPSA